jgi:hypothetical protein
MGAGERHDHDAAVLSVANGAFNERCEPLAAPVGAGAHMSGDPILAALARLEAGQTSLRVDLMARIDRLQDVVTLQHEERIVDIGSTERAERLAKAAQEDAAAIGNIVTPLVRLVHGMRTQLDDLAEQVRVLKERPPAA